LDLVFEDGRRCRRIDHGSDMQGPFLAYSSPVTALAHFVQAAALFQPRLAKLQRLPKPSRSGPKPHPQSRYTRIFSGVAKCEARTGKNRQVEADQNACRRQDYAEDEH
jgi:hypothetical protein